MTEREQVVEFLDAWAAEAEGVERAVALHLGVRITEGDHRGEASVEGHLASLEVEGVWYNTGTAGVALYCDLCEATIVKDDDSHPLSMLIAAAHAHVANA